MKPADRTDYIVCALMDAAAMYEGGARAFLAEHDTEVVAERDADTGRPVDPNPDSDEDAPEFFQPDCTYQRRRWRFQCLAAGPDPFTGETRAVGYLYRLGEPATATALDPDDWAHGEWTEADAAGGDAL